MASFDTLSEANFCTSYYSILLEQSDKNVAEIVKIPREILDNVKTGIQAATVQIYKDDILPDMIHRYLVECVEEPCSQLLKILHLPASVPSRSSTAILALCRALSLLADLGLVSYVGSHATRFDKEHLGRDVPTITVGNGESDSLSFDCRTRPLACLRGFLDGEQVWVFRCSVGSLKSFSLKDDLRPELSILAHIEEFADIWGPVWSMPSDKGPPGSVRQRNVSKGVICRVDEAETQKGKPVRCHWYSWGQFQMRRANRFLSLSKPLYLQQDDLLLIGTRFRNNQDCTYTLDQTERDYGHEMGVLGGECAAWELDFDSRNVSFSFSKVVGFAVSGTQKRRPQTSLKQLIVAKWKTEPQTANPGILNQCLGVEISHCTGNAQRVRIKDLLLMSIILPLLELHFPDWFRRSWGPQFLEALKSNDPEAVFRVWVTYEANRSEMAALVCWVLGILDKTGAREDGLTAAFFNGRRECSITFNDCLNGWARLLRDSHLMATYAFMNEVCIECHTPDHSTATCNGEAAYTVLATQLGLKKLKNSETPDVVKVQPYGPLCKTIEKLDLKTLRMKPIARGASGAYVVGDLLSIKSLVPGQEIRDGTAKAAGRYKVFLRASTTSHGGMKVGRGRSRAIQAGRAPQNDVGNQSTVASSSAGDLERPKSISAFGPATNVLLSRAAGLQVSSPNVRTHTLHSPRVQEPVLNRATSNLRPIPPIETILTRRLIPPRLLFPTEVNLSALPDQRSPATQYGVGNERDHSISQAPGQMLSDEPSNTGTSLRSTTP